VKKKERLARKREKRLGDDWYKECRRLHIDGRFNPQWVEWKKTEAYRQYMLMCGMRMNRRR
jgi:hypothetical protein